MKFPFPNNKRFELNTVILDLNGTVTVGGKIVPGVPGRILKLKSLRYRVVLLTGDTRGNAMRLARELGVELVITKDGAAKRAAALGLGTESLVAIGNGLIDLPLMRVAKLGIVTLQAEGVHARTLAAADVVVPSILDALDLLIEPDRLVATLRN